MKDLSNFRLRLRSLATLMLLSLPCCTYASGPLQSVSCSATATDGGIPAPQGMYAATCTRVYTCSPSDPWPKKNNGVLGYVASVSSDDHCYNVGHQIPTTNNANISLEQYALNGTESGDAVSVFYGRVLSYRTEGNGCAGPYTPFYSGVNPAACTPPPPPPVCTPSSGPPYLPPDVGAEYVWSSTTCQWVLEPCSQAGCASPIIIDTDGSGFHLASAAGGVRFDFFGDGHPIEVAWTASGSTNGWLAMDRNGNGLIDSAREMFGNITAQPTEGVAHPNGFLALAVFDSNGDGVIDKKDSVWPNLLVWIDANHDGVSQMEELHPLDEVGIHSIALKYTEARYVDAYGNVFRYKGHLNPDKEDDIDRVIYDVFLSTK